MSGTGLPRDVDAIDRGWMWRALDQARRGLYITTPNPRVGCVLVRDGRILGEGFTQPAGQDHAEIAALRDCAARGQSPRGATAYVSLEPCAHFGRTPPCTDALISAEVSRVVAAVGDPNPRVAGRGLGQLEAAGIAVRCGVLADEARELNIGFFSRMERGRPWVRAKLAAALDGRTALANGQSRWITGAEARRDGHAWRARACAVMTGIGTVRADDPSLTVREVSTPRQPARIVVDRSAETPADAKVFSAGAVVVFTSAQRPADWPAHVECVRCADSAGDVDLGAMMNDLGRREMNELHVEAGAGLTGALLRSGLVDELLVYVAPVILGDSARGMFALPALESLEDAPRVRIVGVDRMGEDVRIIARLGVGNAAAR